MENEIVYNNITNMSAVICCRLILTDVQSKFGRSRTDGLLGQETSIPDRLL